MAALRAVYWDTGYAWQYWGPYGGSTGDARRY